MGQLQCIEANRLNESWIHLRAAGYKTRDKEQPGEEGVKWKKKAFWQPGDRGNAELITNPSPGVRQHIMTPTRWESLLIKVKGDQLSWWLPTNIRGNRMFNGLCTYRRLFSTPRPRTDKQDRTLLINLTTFKAPDKRIIRDLCKLAWDVAKTAAPLSARGQTVEEGEEFLSV